MGMGDQRQAPADLSSGMRAGTSRTGGRVGHRVGLDTCGKSRPPSLSEFDPRTAQPVASRYTV
jgi:hypothetical protein